MYRKRRESEFPPTIVFSFQFQSQEVFGNNSPMFGIFQDTRKLVPRNLLTDGNRRLTTDSHSASGIGIPSYRGFAGTENLKFRKTKSSRKKKRLTNYKSVAMINNNRRKICCRCNEASANEYPNLTAPWNGDKEYGKPD